MEEEPMMKIPAHMQQQMMPPQTQGSAQMPGGAQSKNPMNLTDDQMQALIVAASAAIAFSSPVQEKLGSTIPSFFVNGDRSTAGLVASGVVAAAVFYFGQRLAMKM